MSNFLGFAPVSNIREGFIGRENELNELTVHLSKEPIVLIEGVAGVGKTSLSYVYAEVNKGLYKNGIHRYYAHYQTNSLNDILAYESIKPESLVIIDEFDFTSPELSREIIFESKRGVKFLLISRSSHSELSSYKKIVLEGFSHADLASYIRQRELMGYSIEEVNALFEWSSGSPLVMDLALNAIRDEKLSFKEVQHFLSRFDSSGIIDSQGRPISSQSQPPPAIIRSVQYVNDEMIRDIYANPKTMHTLSPRQFEELTAELLYRQGYTVELTPASGDGGVDIYAAKKDGVGTFMYLVECKKYSPKNKVGVSVVRSLHGVVQHKRANAGLVVTTSSFTKGAKEFQAEIKYQLQLADYMALHEWLEKIAKGA